MRKAIGILLNILIVIVVLIVVIAIYSMVQVKMLNKKYVNFIRICNISSSNRKYVSRDGNKGYHNC